MLFLHAKRDATILANSVIAAGLSGRTYKASTDALTRELTNYTMWCDTINAVSTLTGMIRTEFGIRYQFAVCICHVSFPGITNQWPALCNAADQAFCNASPFLLKDLTSRAKKQTLKADFEAYLDGFSPNVQEILDKFKFRNQIDTMIDADILGAVIEKFVSPTINLSPKPVYTDDTMTTIKLPALDNHGMGTVFEELVRKFNEANNEEAGEHWTPRDVVDLMADLIFIPIADEIKDATYSCYDGACGTGGMLTVAQDRLMTLAKRRNKEVSIHLFGQEVQPETYAICKADMLLKGDGDQADHIAYGSTLSADGNASRQFDFMLANPPYGKSWKTDAEKMGGKKIF